MSNNTNELKISVSGGNVCGKSTVLVILAAHLRRLGYDVEAPQHLVGLGVNEDVLHRAICEQTKIKFEERVVSAEEKKVADAIERLDAATRYQNFNKLINIVHRLLTPEYTSMLNKLCADRTEISDVSGKSETTYLGFMNAPAGKGVHHAYEGGLVVHLLEMWELWGNLKTTIQAEDQNSAVTDESVLKGIILHDLHKAWCSFVRDDKLDSGVNYGNHPSSSLMTNDVKTMFILNMFEVQPDAYDINCLTNSEGGFAKAPPRYQTPLAKVVYVLDELSASISRMSQNNVLDIRKAGFPKTCHLDPRGREDA